MTPTPAAADETRAGPPHALIERRGHVLIVTMNRPEVRNALSGPMMALMRQAWDETDSDPEHQGLRPDRRGRCVLRGRRPEGDDHIPSGRLRSARAAPTCR